MSRSPYSSLTPWQSVLVSGLFAPQSGALTFLQNSGLVDTTVLPAFVAEGPAVFDTFDRLPETGGWVATDPCDDATASDESVAASVDIPAEAIAIEIWTDPGDQNTRALIYGTKWSGPINYEFPDVYSDYGAYGHSFTNFMQVSFEQWQAVRFILEGTSAFGGGPVFRYGSYESVTNAEFFSNDTGNAAFDISIASADFYDGANIPTAFGYYPSNNQIGGDIWFGQDYASYRTPQVGTYEWHTHIHELGHAMGLKHGHEIGGRFTSPMESARDSMEFSVMTYRSYVGHPATGYFNERFGYAQTLMMYDIHALQSLYGADYTTHAENSVYYWNPTTGEMFVNGVGQGAPGNGAGGEANRVFLTIWDGNGHDTYDMSNYTTAVSIDLTPGSWSTTSQAQLVNLGGGNYARGTVFNALMWGSDTRSLIEDAIGGTGNDTIIGNVASNMLSGNDGDDTMYGHGGSDTISGGNGNDYILIESTVGSSCFAMGGDGNDTIYGGAGNDYIQGDAGDDIIVGLGGMDSLYGGNGNDTVIAGDGPGSVVDGGAGGNSLWGASGNDYMVGGEWCDTIVGRSGNDYLFGYAGDDSMYGGSGTDYLFGNTGNDFIWTDDAGGAQSADYIYVGGGTNVDTIADFTAGDGTTRDVLVVSLGSGFTSYSQIMANTTQSGVYSVITMGADQVYLYNVSTFQLTANNFIFL